MNLMALGIVGAGGYCDMKRGNAVYLCHMMGHVGLAQTDVIWAGPWLSVVLRRGAHFSSMSRASAF